MNDSHLAALEKNAYRTLVDDGALDLCLSLFVFAFGLVFATDVHMFGEVDLPVLLFLLIPLLWKGLRSRVVEPRAGFVRLHAARMEKIRRGKKTVFYLYIGITVGIFLLIEWNAGWSEQLREIGTILVGVAVGLPIAIAAFLFQVRRWTLYAGVILGATIMEYAVDAPFGTGWLAASGVILVGGLFVLMTFLRAHPVHPDLERADA